MMLKQPEEWTRFQPELKELVELWNSFPKFEVVYRPKKKNVKAELLAKNARTRRKVFSFIDTMFHFGL